MYDQYREIRFILFADTHLGYDYPIRPRIQRRRRGEDFFDNYRQVLAYAARTNADFVVHGGDFFFRSKVAAKIVDLAYASLLEFADRVPIYIVPGNHERSVLPASLFLSHPNIHVFADPCTFEVPLDKACVALSGFPFERVDVRGRFRSLVKRTGWQRTKADIRLLCMHQTVEGATVGPGDYTFRFGRDVIRSSDLPPDFLAVLSGHIHRRQVLRTLARNGHSPPVIYPGSTQRTSIAEKDEVKGFYEIRIINQPGAGWKLGELIFHPLPSAGESRQFVATGASSRS
jgi:exonuclease SbcD